MSRLDRHVDAVQNKLAMAEFLVALAASCTVLAGAVWLAILIDKLFQLRLPQPLIWLSSAAGVAVLVAIGYAVWRRPTRHAAAVAIDEKLGLKERFSTALYARPTKDDPFAAAAVLDAERMADNVSIHKRFPLPFPRGFMVAMVLAMLAGLSLMLPEFDLFGRREVARKKAVEVAKVESAKKTVREALAKVESVAKAMPADDEIAKNAKQQLEALINNPGKDPEATKRSALKAMQDMNDAIKEKIKDNQKFADAQNDAKMLRSIAPPADEKGPVADAHRAIAKGEFAKAVDDLQKAVENFDKMDEKEKEKAAQQMQQMAKQLQQMAQNPQVQQQLQQQLQQMGANQQQAQQMAQAMQQAAQGNPQAQQQLAQMQQQLMQGMNPQQQAQAQQMIQQMQAKANGQAQAQQMAQAAQQMAQAMQQGAQAAQQQAQNPQGQGQGQQQQQQQMAQAAQQMQQQLQQMEAAQQDAQQIAAAQQIAQDGADQAANDMNDDGGGPGGDQANQQAGGENGQWQPGDPADQKGNGMGGAGIGNGGKAEKQEAPYAVKSEMSPSQDNKDGKILAATFVKASALKGESKVELSNIAASAEKEATDEVDQERVTRSAQKAVRDYFKSMEQDAK